MNKLFILLTIFILTPVILLWPVDTPIYDNSRHDWGGDQNGYREFCGEPLEYRHYYFFELGSDETHYHKWIGGCRV